MNHSITLLATACAAMLSLSSCINGGGSGLARYQAYDRPASLPSNPNAVRVKVSLRNQMVYVMEGTRPLLIAPCTVGTTAYPTPQGNFTIFNKTEFKRANSHGWATNGKQAKQTKIGNIPSGWKFKGTPMPYWCEFKMNYGIHTGWVKPYPSSHGCIRMHENLSPKFFRLVKVGTPINIATSQPEDATIGRNIPRPPDAGPLPDYSPSVYLGNGYFRRHKTPTFE
jgi:hypothetical protein